MCSIQRKNTKTSDDEVSIAPSEMADTIGTTVSITILTHMANYISVYSICSIIAVILVFVLMKPSAWTSQIKILF